MAETERVGSGPTQGQPVAYDPSSWGGVNGYVVIDSATGRFSVCGEGPFDKFAELATGFP